ncbi:type I polyketide synthase [Tolypothrix campylonemoides VB511288]|nr:type I polyketide synthase [Tolypothrix campylonemoides VB511288]
MNNKSISKTDNTRLKQAILALEQMQAKLDAIERSKTEPIAIVGMSCRFPGADSPEAFWQLLQQGRDVITEIPTKRWDNNRYYDPDPEALGKIYTRFGGFIEAVDQFEPQFFGISPREAVNMDPQQRLLLEESYLALERACIAPDSLFQSSTGVYFGIGNNEYAQLLDTQQEQKIEAYNATGNAPSVIAGRLSYTLGLTGPAMVVDTACSSSLVAVHLAVQSLRQHECNLALAGGVNLLLYPRSYIALSRAKMLSPDGRCKTFDIAANGYVRSEGCGVIVLKRLSDVANGDNVLALIRGTGINQDGPSGGLTVPNGPSQEAVIRQALASGLVSPKQVDYIEAHGTGTSLGDPIEVGALGVVFGKTHSQEHPLFVGSVKTNIGHTEAAAGIAGLIKVVLALQNQQIPPNLHLSQPNPHINWEQLPVKVPTELTPWFANGKQRLAGVSSFGFSGTNAHVVLEEEPFGESGSTGAEGQRSNTLSPAPLPPCPPASPTWERTLHLLTLSAKTETALQQLAQRYQEHLAAYPELSLSNVCFSANTGRSHFHHRLAVVAASTEELVEKLVAHCQQLEVVGIVSGEKPSTTPKVAFLFTGQGSQYVGMGRQLYNTQPTFRKVIERCDEILRPYLDKPLLSVLYADKTTADARNSQLLDQTAYTQPALFAVEYALCQLWQSWGIEPDVVMGHSVGEYVAATVAGVLSLEDALMLIAERARLMQALPSNGAMVAVKASADFITQLLAPYGDLVAIAAINGPQSVVISGEQQAIETVCQLLTASEVKTKALQVSHAFHSPLMEPMVAEFRRVAGEISYSRPKVKIISNLTGLEVSEEIATPEYWCRHIQCPVQFAASMKTLEEQGIEVFLEIGPKPILLGMGRMCVSESGQLWLPSLRYEQSDWQQLLESLAQLYVRGVAVDWKAFDAEYPRNRVVLPTYPFQRQRYWIETSENGHQLTNQSTVATQIVNLLNQGETEALAQHLKLARNFSPEQLQLLPELLEVLVKQHQQQLAIATIKDWFYQVQWKPIVLSQLKTSIQQSHWLIFADTTGVGEKLAKKLRHQGCECSLVYRGDSYQKLETGFYQLNPSKPQEFEQLIQAILENSEFPLEKVIHLWSLDTPSPVDLTMTTINLAQLWGCGTVLHLLQAVIKTSSVPQLWLVTRGAQSVLSKTEEVSVTASPLWGMGRVVSLEHPQLWGGLVDLDPQTPQEETEALLQLLVDNNQPEDHLALRGERTYIARLVKQSLKPSQPLSLESNATYLITGGLGALGLHTAKWMVEKGARHLVLISRTQPSQHQIAAISNLQQQGAQVVVAQADVCNFEELSKVFEQVDSHHAPLKGIVHAAGVGSFQLMQQMELTQLEEVMAAKVMGGWMLHQLTQDKELDFFVSFSSIAAVWGAAGQAHYAASNHFLDALTHYRRAKGLPSFSINWGPWSGGGMAGEIELGELRKRGVESLSPQQGTAALEQLWTSGNVQTTVANVNWSLFKQLYQIGRRLLLEEIEVEPLKTQLSNSQAIAEILQQLKAASPTEREKFLLNYFKDVISQVLRMSASQVDVQQPLNTMGLDSLMALELRNRLQTDLAVDVPVVKFIEDISIVDLAAEVNGQVTQIDRTQTVESENNQPTLLTHVKDSQRITGEI